MREVRRGHNGPPPHAVPRRHIERDGLLRPELVATLVPQLLAAGRAATGRSPIDSLDIDGFEDDGFPEEPDDSDTEPTVEVPEP